MKAFEWNGEEGFEVGDVGGMGGAVLLLHHGHHVTTCDEHHPMHRIRQLEGVGWPMDGTKAPSRVLKPVR